MTRELFVAILPIVEILIACSSGFMWLKRLRHPYPSLTALTLGIICGLGGLSVILQIEFLAGLPKFAWLLEVFALAGIIFNLRPRWDVIIEIPQKLISFSKKAPPEAGILGIALVYLLLQAILLPPSSWDAMTYHLPRVLLWEQNHTLLLRDYSLYFQAVFPVGSDILYHLFLRLQTDYGLGIFSWLSYVVILLGTYELARPRVGQEIALTSSLLIASMPNFIYAATATKNDIIVAAVAVGCMLWADYWLRRPSIDSLSGLGLTLAFGISVKITFLFFAAPFIFMYICLTLKKKKLKMLACLVSNNKKNIFLMILPVFVMSQCWLFLNNYHQFGGWLGPKEVGNNNQNHDGLVGGIANLIRYSFQSIHFTRPVDRAFHFLFGWPITEMLQLIYDSNFRPTFGQLGYALGANNAPFQIKWQPEEATSWFGPLSTLVIVPASIWSVIWGQGFSKLMLYVGGFLVLAISYQLGWDPWRCRFFMLTFVSTGPCVSAFFKELGVKRWVLSGIRFLCLLIVCYACAFNTLKPIVISQVSYKDNYPLIKQDIWSLSHWAQDRLVYEDMYAKGRVEAFSELVPDAKIVALAGYDRYFQFMFRNSELTFLPIRTLGGESLTMYEERLEKADYLFCMSKSCDEGQLNLNLNRIWTYQTNEGGWHTELYKITPK